jgi:Lar family restriction alleviation protein
MPIKLKPCPKCGREPAPFRITFNLFDGEPPIRHQYRCHRCGICGKVCGDLAEAAEAWNRRADDATD